MLPNIRRLYFYIITLVSLETVLWGGISAARLLLAGEVFGGSASRLAGVLSLALIGAPLFLLHWFLVQRRLRQDPEERSTGLWALFLYLTLLLTLVPVVQNVLALVDRLWLGIFHIATRRALLGGEQTTAGNLAAIALNGLAAFYFFRVLRSAWQPAPLGNDFGRVRWRYRYIWLVYSLALALLGAQQTLEAFLRYPAQSAAGWSARLPNGLALLLVGAPLCYFIDHITRTSLQDPDERKTLLHLRMLYIWVFASGVVVLASAVMVLYGVLNVAYGDRPALANFLFQISRPLTAGIVLAVIASYYGRSLRAVAAAERSTLPDSTTPTIPVSSARRETRRRLVLPQRAGMRRIFFYGFALLGLAAVLFGLHLALGLLLDWTLSPATISDIDMRQSLAAAISLLAIGAPVWVVAWRPMQAEAAPEGEPGDVARRSSIRRSYFSLVLTAGIAGGLFSLGLLLYQVLRALFGDTPGNILLAALEPLKALLLFAVLLAYHGLALRADNRLLERSLARRHAQFPVLVLAPDDEISATPEVQSGDGAEKSLSGFHESGGFAAAMIAALQHQAPAMPVAVHHYSLGVPDETLSAARAVILPADLLARPSEAIRLWLQGYSGTRIVIPTPTQGWRWVFGDQRSLARLARQAAQIIRNLSEEEIYLSK